jgi:hypothetical protein
MRRVEKNLDSFWKTVDEHFKEKTGKTLHELLSRVLTPRELERTPEWIEPTKSVTSDPALYATVDKFSILDIEERTQRTVATATETLVKTKVKTRGQPTQAAIEGAVFPEPVTAPVPATITVSKRAHKLFSVLFYNPAHDVPPGEVPWSEFLRAFSDIGFAVEKQYGSAWLFTPPDVGLRPMIFHEPHPSGKISIRIARRVGWRLTRTYGWTNDTFAPE